MYVSRIYKTTHIHIHVVIHGQNSIDKFPGIMQRGSHDPSLSQGLRPWTSADGRWLNSFSSVGAHVKMPRVSICVPSPAPLHVSLPAMQHHAAGVSAAARIGVAVSVQHRITTFIQIIIILTDCEGSQGRTKPDAADMRLLSGQYFNQAVMNGYCRRHYQGLRQRSNSLIPVIVQVCCVGCGGVAAASSLSRPDTPAHNNPHLKISFNHCIEKQDGGFPWPLSYDAAAVAAVQRWCFQATQ